jgi:hypothetical protein
MWKTLKTGDNSDLEKKAKSMNVEWTKPELQSINQSITQSINQSIDRPINQSINRSINQSTHPSNGQSNDQSINQSINQSIERPISWKFGNSNFQRAAFEKLRLQFTFQTILQIFGHQIDRCLRMTFLFGPGALSNGILDGAKIRFILQLMPKSQTDSFNLMEDRKMRRVDFIPPVDISNHQKLPQSTAQEVSLVRRRMSSQDIFLIYVVWITQISTGMISWDQDRVKILLSSHDGMEIVNNSEGGRTTVLVPANQSINQSTARSTNRLIDGSINQSINHLDVQLNYKLPPMEIGDQTFFDEP